VYGARALMSHESGALMRAVRMHLKCLDEFAIRNLAVFYPHIRT